jgi:hypothetical protein
VERAQARRGASVLAHMILQEAPLEKDKAPLRLPRQPPTTSYLALNCAERTLVEMNHAPANQSRVLPFDSLSTPKHALEIRTHAEEL